MSGSGSGPGGLDRVRFEFTKWNGARHWHYDVRRLGTDEYGTWLGAPRGTIVQRGDEPAQAHPHGFVKLVPATGWWAAIFNSGTAGRFEVYADIGTPAEWSDGAVTMIDLDLDVVRFRSGLVAVLDEDEFLEHQIRDAYPERVIDAARSAAAGLALAMERRDEPFGNAAGRWLNELDRTRG